MAEDDDLVRRVLSRALREYGYTVLEAGDGAEALEVVAAQAVPPSLVIADVVVAVRDGACRWRCTSGGPISRCCSCPAIPISIR